MLPVVTSAEAAARDASAIGAGIPSRALMQRAGAALASEVALRFRSELERGVVVFAGPGNNGGDGWVIARALGAAGVKVRVIEPLAAKTDDARAERALALEALGPALLEPWRSTPEVAPRSESVVVDALLGTGATGAPEGDLAQAVITIRGLRARGARIVAVDLPTGLDATTGVCAGEAVEADVTFTFGSVKRGQLLDRDRCGALVVLDIGLGKHANLDDRAPRLIDAGWVASHVPDISAKAHKGTRKKLAIVGGAVGMAGASMLAGRAALRSGAGMVKLVVEPGSLEAVQQGEPSALAAVWPEDDAAFEREISSWADALVIGPGLGRSARTRSLVDHFLAAWRGPVLLDADALNVYEGQSTELGKLLKGRAALVTPHPMEFSRLAGVPLERVLTERFEIGRDLAATLGAAVLLKGVPTVVFSSDGERWVSAAGTPALATAGSGDVLSGIAGALLAQTGSATTSAAVGAWMHGRAAEHAGTRGVRMDGEPLVGLAPPLVRGITLDDVLEALRDSWQLQAGPTRYPVLAELAAVGPGR